MLKCHFWLILFKWPLYNQMMMENHLNKPALILNMLILEYKALERALIQNMLTLTCKVLEQVELKLSLAYLCSPGPSKLGTKLWSTRKNPSHPVKLSCSDLAISRFRICLPVKMSIKRTKRWSPATARISSWNKKL